MHPITLCAFSSFQSRGSPLSASASSHQTSRVNRFYQWVFPKSQSRTKSAAALLGNNLERAVKSLKGSLNHYGSFSPLFGALADDRQIHYQTAWGVFNHTAWDGSLHSDCFSITVITTGRWVKTVWGDCRWAPTAGSSLHWIDQYS